MSTALDLLPETTLDVPFKWDKPFKTERWHSADETAKSLLGFFTFGVMFAGLIVGLTIQSILAQGALSEPLNTFLPIAYPFVVGLPAFILMRKHLIKAKKRWWEEFTAFREEKGAVLGTAIRSLGVFKDEEEIWVAAYDLAGGCKAAIYTPEGYKYVAELFNKTIILRLQGREIHEKIRLASTAQRLGIPLADKSEVEVKAELWVSFNPEATLLDAYLAGNKG